MVISSKNVLVSHVLLFTAGVLSGGYVEDCDVFQDEDGFILGRSDIVKTEIKPKQLAALAKYLMLAYRDVDESDLAEDLDEDFNDESFLEDDETDYVDAEPAPAQPETMPDVTAAPNMPEVAKEPLPEEIEIVKVEDLNGEFSPQTGNIQPTVVGVPEPVQVEVIHSADEVKGDIVEARVDDWAAIAASEIAKNALAAANTPEATPEVTPVAVETTVLPVAEPLPVASAELPSENVPTLSESTLVEAEPQGVNQDDIKATPGSDKVEDPSFEIEAPQAESLPQVSDLLPETVKVAEPAKATRRPKKLNDVDNSNMLDTQPESGEAI